MPQNILPQNIIQDFGLQDLPQEQQEELVGLMVESLLKRLAIMVMEELSEADQEEFAKLQESKDAEKIDEFLKTKIPNYEQKLEKTVEEFREEMKSRITDLNAALGR